MEQQNAHTPIPANYNPYLVVLAHETLAEAIKRHRRETGHEGGFIVVYRAPDKSNTRPQ